jgi:acetolactate synthase-1/2/3 large subunit
MRGVGVNQVGLNARRMLNLDDPALDFVSIARGMGVEAARADTADELVKQLDGAMGRRGPFLIEAVL